jgi:hypothetical protein
VRQVYEFQFLAVFDILAHSRVVILDIAQKVSLGYAPFGKLYILHVLESVANILDFVYHHCIVRVRNFDEQV